MDIVLKIKKCKISGVKTLITLNEHYDEKSFFTVKKIIKYKNKTYYIASNPSMYCISSSKIIIHDFLTSLSDSEKTLNEYFREIDKLEIFKRIG